MIVGFFIVPEITPSGIKTEIFNNRAASTFLTITHDTFYNLRCRKLRYVFCHDSDHPCLLIAQTLSNIVWAVAHPVKGFQHSFFCLFVHLWFSVQNVRHSRRGNITFSGNLLQRNHSYISPGSFHIFISAAPAQILFPILS